MMPAASHKTFNTSRVESRRDPACRADDDDLVLTASRRLTACMHALSMTTAFRFIAEKCHNKIHFKVKG